MTHLLDTNACVHFLRKSGKPRVRHRLSLHRQLDVVLCSVVAAELYYGAEKSQNPAAEQAKVDTFVSRFICVGFDAPETRIYARVRADLERRGLPIGWNDYQVAAIALANNLTLVTHDTAEFSRVPGLNLEDWEIP